MLVPIPDLESARRVLCVQPHYDDNDIGAGGTIAALAERGAQIAYLTATDDLIGVRDASLSDAQARELLRGEQASAAAEIGVAEQHWLDLPDAGDYDYYTLRRAIAREIRRFRPDFVLTCDPWLPYEAHSDHIRVGRAAAEAVLLHRLPRFRTEPEIDTAYEGHTLAGVGFYFSARPNVVFDISTSRERKHRALDAYRSQFAGPDLMLLHAVLSHKEQQWGAREGFAYGEALKVVSPIHLHVNPDAEELCG
jgi:N,N'-diacetylchitobiose non-reducing end deacetylase